MKTSFYNTVRLTAAQLIKANAKAITQEEKIHNLFKSMPLVNGKGLTPSQVLIKTPGLGKIPLTSVRRAMSNLTRDTRLIKTDETIEGPYGMPEHVWILNRGF